ncbi:MAG: 1-deoxy-D-xylulose-5-phosphate reductoisomerase [Limnohabitans sp.]|nr:1-deoxy-D-xylulose-5-phosphate reductoisomerase [Limnohabitans sp.]
MTQSKKRLTILGATGSIGKNTLDVVSHHLDRFELFALTGAQQVDLMFAQCMQFKPMYAVMVQEDCAKSLNEKLKNAGSSVTVLSGSHALDEVASNPQVDIVMAAIVGAAGLSSCLSAAKAGKRLLLANKEALVVGGQVFLNAVREGGALLLPIDSEHSAVFQSMPEDRSTWLVRVEKIILTASGGPFRQMSVGDLKKVTPDQACAHPNWVMGRKISVDSATMMNKVLEVIEARYLFDWMPEKIEVVIHPQSIIHSMVQYKDTSVMAQLGTPDMRMPISYGLGWPDRLSSGASKLDFMNLPPMTFESIDSNQHRLRFPGLQLAWDSLNAKGGTTAVLNAANEVGVAAFLAGQIRFDQIHHVTIQTLTTLQYSAPNELAHLLQIDREARLCAHTFVKQWSA